MSDADTAVIVDRLTRIEAGLQELRTSIAGDKFNNKVGIVDIIGTLHREVYGEDATKHIGLKQKAENDDKRIRSLENDRMKLFAWVAGIGTGMGAVGAAIVKWIFK